MNKGRFTIRIYGLLLHRGMVLLSDEHLFGKSFTKFPGGGLEFGESTIEGLIREFREELNLEIGITRHFYTTDFFQESAFHPGIQVISIYYLVHSENAESIVTGKFPYDFEIHDGAQCFRWVILNELMSSDLSFPIDQHVASLLKDQASSLR